VADYRADSATNRVADAVNTFKQAAQTSVDNYKHRHPLPTFTESAHKTLRDSQLRRNLNKATTTIRGKRTEVVDELPDWQALREAGRALKERTLRHLDDYLEQLEASVTAAGGQVHWAADALEANQIVRELVVATGTKEVIKVKSMTTEEIRLNDALSDAGVDAIETDLAELIIQLAHEESSHILVPAIHKNRSEIRELFMRTMNLTELSDTPSDLAAAARRFLREKFLDVEVGISGANFAVADTGSIAVVESEGNGRMCLTLPKTLISVMGIEKVIPTWQDLEVFLQLLPRSSTGERMNPYTTLWTGVHQGDGPQTFHLVLLDNGRTDVLADKIGRQTLNCIRCSACLNVCPVYERAGGHAYHSVYPGPIGAILTPQLVGIENASSLPYASSLCGACYEVCPVKINIPEVLVHLRGKDVQYKQDHGGLKDKFAPEALAMKAVAQVFASPQRYEAAQALVKVGQMPFKREGYLKHLPFLSGWTDMRDLKAVPNESFRDWWKKRQKSQTPKGKA
jgi:L-lactate dehydrogenase complex protein LldF